MAQRQWTDEQRQSQREKIHQWKPWQHSTGAKTAEGKARCSQNANKGRGALMAELRQAIHELKAETEYTQDLIQQSKR